MTQIDPTLPTDPTPAPTPGGAKIPYGWIAVLADPKVWGALVYAFGAIWGAKYLAGDLPADQKLELYKAALLSVGGVTAAVIAALGYQTGKLFEGVVPKGFAAASNKAGNAPAAAPLGSSSVQVPAGASVLVTPASDATAHAIESLYGGAAEIDPNAPAPVRPGIVRPLPGRGSTTGLVLLAMIATIAFASGCSTSEPFKRTIGPIVKLAASEDADYVKADSTIDDATRQKREIDAAELAATVADEKKIDAATVEKEWADVAPVYRGYIASDPAIRTPESRAIRDDTPNTIDKLVGQERARQKSFFGLFAPKAQ
jgi:hypothetical protein